MKDQRQVPRIHYSAEPGEKPGTIAGSCLVRIITIATQL